MENLRLINQINNDLLTETDELKKAKLETLKSWLNMFDSKDTLEDILTASNQYKEELEVYIEILRENEIQNGLDSLDDNL